MLVTFFACGTEKLSPSKLFVKEMGDPTYYKDVFDYNDGHLISFKRFFGTREETNTQFYYLNNLLVKVEVKKDQGLEFTVELKNGENALRKEEKLTMIYNGDTTYIRTGNFIYVGNALKSITYSYNDPANYPTSEIDFGWADGNITRIDNYSYDSFGRRYNGYSTYVYDNKLNYSNQDIAFIYTVGTGDETKVSKNNQGGSDYKYLYNDKGYPIEYTHLKLDHVILKYE